MSEDKGSADPAKKGVKGLRLESYFPVISSGSSRPAPATIPEDDPDKVLEKLENDAFKDLAKDYRISKIETLREEEELKKAKLRKERRAIDEENADRPNKDEPVASGAVAQSDISAADEAFVERISDWSEEKQLAAVKKLAVLRQAARQKGGAPMDALSTMLLMSYGEKPSTSANDVGTYADKLIDAVTTGMAIASQGKGGESVTDKLLVDAFNKLTTNPQAAAKPDDWLDKIGKLKDLGFIYTPSDFTRMLQESRGQTVQLAPPGQSNSELEMKRLDMDFQLKLQSMKDDREYKKEQIVAEKERTKVLTDGLESVVGTAAEVMGRREAQSLGEAGATDQALQTAAADQVAEAPCMQCGTKLVIPNPAMPRQITCNNCGKVQLWGPKPA